MHSTINTLKNHTSIRKFSRLPVSNEMIQTIIDCAMRAPSAGNMMQYTIICVQDKDTLTKLAKSCDNQPFIANAGFALLFVADTYKWKSFFDSRNVMDHGKPYPGPTMPDFMLAVQDAMIAAQTAVIAAESLGLGTCYIGDIMEQVEFHRDLFKLPPYTMPITLVVMGHYDSKPKLRNRFEKQYVVSNEVYPSVDEDFINGMFKKEEDAQENFAQNFYSRKIEAAFFKEMIRSVGIYLSQWLGSK